MATRATPARTAPIQAARRHAAPSAATGALGADFYERPVVEVAHDLIGCVVEYGKTAGMIVETEAYHDGEPACHAFAGLTPRTRTLFGEPGRAYVYRSYGIHALLNAVCEPEGVGAAVLIRALEPIAGIEEMRERRRLHDEFALCSGPGKLTQALGVELGHNETDLARGPVTIHPSARQRDLKILVGTRIGISKAVELPWRFCLAGNQHVSRPHLSASAAATPVPGLAPPGASPGGRRRAA
jgi:DNA-3-methyladenine glycosylase